MASAKNAKIQLEAGQTLVAFEAATDSGDAKVFNPSALIMSGKIDPVIRPDGVVTGVNLISADAADDTVAVAAFTANSQGTVHAVSSGTVDVSADRPATDVACIVSITMTSAGVLASIAGTSAADTTFLETRGDAGGPPHIPVGSVELGQLRLVTSAASVIADAEIFQNGAYTEFASFPVYESNNIGEGDSAEETAKVNAFVSFSEALPKPHTGDVAKGVYVQYYTPNLADIGMASDFSPAETSHSISSEEYYGGSIASSSESLGQGSFTALLTDGVTDMIVTKKNQKLTVKTFPDRNKSAYMLTQGYLAVSRSFPVSGQINASVTITAEKPSAEFSG